MYKHFTPKSNVNQLEISHCERSDRVSGSASGRILSNAHNCPQDITREVIFYKDGSKITVKRPNYKLQGIPSYGLRGSITKFSWQSRRRLMYKIAEISNKTLPVFVTLTYPDKFPSDPVQWKHHLNSLFKRLKRKYPNIAIIWKLEPQARGAPHYHLLVWGAAYIALWNTIPYEWYEVVNSGDKKHLLWHLGALGHGNTHCVSQVRSWRGVMAYASKYLGKECDAAGWDSPGRFWGVKSRENIPWAEILRATIGYQDGYKLIRLMRRYAHLKPRAYQSLNIFCNSPNFWYENLAKIINSS